MSSGERVAGMGNYPSTIYQSIAHSLEDANQRRTAVQVERPGSVQVGFGGVVEAERQTKFTLLAVRMFLQRRAALVGSRIYIRRFDSLSDNGRDRLGQPMMKRSRDALIVSDVAIALAVSPLQSAKTDQLPEMSSQAGEMQGMYQPGYGGVSPISKLGGRRRKSLLLFFQVRRRCLSINQQVSQSQHDLCGQWQIVRSDLPDYQL